MLRCQLPILKEYIDYCYVEWIQTPNDRDDALVQICQLGVIHGQESEHLVDLIDETECYECKNINCVTSTVFFVNTRANVTAKRLSP